MAKIGINSSGEISVALTGEEHRAGEYAVVLYVGSARNSLYLSVEEARALSLDLQDVVNWADQKAKVSV